MNEKKAKAAIAKEQEALRTEEWKAKHPNAVHPPCPWCEVPHEPVPLRSDGEPDANYCEVNDARLDSEDYARLERRFNELLQWIGFDPFDCLIGELFQGDQWRFFGVGKGCDNEDVKDWERGSSMCELLRRLARIRRDLIICRGMAAEMSGSWRRQAAEKLAAISERAGVAEKPSSSRTASSTARASAAPTSSTASRRSRKR